MPAIASLNLPGCLWRLPKRGIRRFAVGETNPRIVEYNDQTNLVGYDDKVSWCSSFINWCLACVGVRGTRSALARSWLDWGIALEKPNLRLYYCLDSRRSHKLA